MIEFDIPEPKKYRPPFNFDEDIAHYADDSVPTNRAMRESDESTKKLIENEEFEDFSDPPAVSQSTKDQWLQDHSKDFVYLPGFVFDFNFQDGQDMGSVSDMGEWMMLAGGNDGKQHDPPAWFTGGYAWIERFNREHGDVSARDDDPEHGHISVDPSSIYVHYSFKNPSDEMVDYRLQINRLTGRFVEFFKLPDGSDEKTGTCMIFK